MRGYRKLAYYWMLSAAAFLLPVTILAQKTSGTADAGTMKMIREADDQKGKETGAVILLKDYLMTVNDKGQTILVIRVVGKIYTKEALADYSTIPLGYNSYYEEPYLNYARVIHKDGTTREVTKDAIQIKTTPESQGLQYSDSRFFSFALSGMEVGAAFDYQITFSQKEPEVEGAWFDNHRFAGLLLNISPPYLPRIDPVITSIYTLLVPEGTKFQYHLYSGNTEPLIEKTGKQDKYQWTFKNLPTIKIEEAMPNLSSLIPELAIGSLDNWTQIDKWATGKMLSKVEITPQVAAIVKELISGKNSNDDKIKAIANYIKTNIHYIYADLSRGGVTPHSVGEILSSKYGDCKDQSILLISMLKAAGIESYPALINPYPYDQLSDIPNPWFSHLITYISDNGKELWLDMTGDVTPYPVLTITDQNRTVFIINGKGGILTKTPPLSAADNLSVFDMTGSFNNGSVSTSIKIGSHGMIGDVLKSLFKQMDAESRTDALKKLITTHIEKAKFDKVEFSDVNDPEADFSVVFKYHLDTVWKKEQGVFNWGSHTLLPLSILANVDVRSFSEKRTNDIVNPFPYTISGTEKYMPPERDLLPISIPHNDTIKNDFLSFKQAFSRDGNCIILKWSFTYNGTVIPANQYKIYLESIKLLQEKINWKISFVDPVEYITSILKNENPYKLLSFCTQLLQDDPKNVLALLLRGSVYDKLKQGDPSMKAYREALDLAPENKYSLLFITYPPAARNNPAFVAAHLNQALAQDPEFEPALIDRAKIFADMKVFDKAMADINKVLSLNPKSYYGLTTKGAILFKMNKKALSFATFEEALKIDSTDLLLISNLAQSYILIDSSHKAIKLYNMALSMDSNNASYTGNLGWAWYLADNDQKCIEYSKKALSISSTAYYAKYNIALATLRSGKIAEARKLYGELKSDAKGLSQSEIQGAIKDLNDLKAKGKYINEIKAILTDFF
jgi:tetratricopeptide (TPR) repeat protein/transglutaminase-like putative cysteine protease